MAIKIWALGIRLGSSLFLCTRWNEVSFEKKGFVFCFYWLKDCLELCLLQLHNAVCGFGFYCLGV